MLAAPARDWSVFQQIFADHWEVFQHTHPRYQTSYYDELVRKMLDCGNPAKSGPAVGRYVFPAISRRPGDQRAKGCCPLALSESGALRGQVGGEPADLSSAHRSL
jgi:hypothetical protein